MRYIVIARNPKKGGKLLVMTDETECPAEFATETAADREAKKHPLFRAWGFEVLAVPR